MMLRGAVTMVPAASHEMHRLPLPFAGAHIGFGTVVVAGEHLVVIAATALLCLGLSLFFRLSRAGLALRACSENPRIAALMGVSVSGMHTLAWALGAALAACAGLLLAPMTFVFPGMGLIALKAFPAAVLGGMSSLPGALAGGLFLGVVEAIAGLYLPEGVRTRPATPCCCWPCWCSRAACSHRGARHEGPRCWRLSSARRQSPCSAPATR